MVERKQYIIPRAPHTFDWTRVFPEYHDVKLVEFLDVKCGHGGTLVTLATMFPHSLMLGIDMQEEVISFVEKRIETLRNRYEGKYKNIGVYKINAKRHLQNYFFRGQFMKMIFHYTHPNYSLREHRERVINHDLISEHAYLLAEQGKAYIVSENRAVFRYVISRYEDHPSFLRVSEAEMRKDPVAKKIVAVEKKGYKHIKIRIAAFRKLPEETDSEDASADDDLDDEIIEELMKEDAAK